MRIAAAALVLLALAGSATAATRPSLALGRTPTVVVHGAGFATSERLRVTVFVGSVPIVRNLTATRLGRFTLRLAVRREPCVGGPVAQAFGVRSGLVRLRLPVRDCPELVPGVGNPAP